MDRIQKINKFTFTKWIFKIHILLNYNLKNVSIWLTRKIYRTVRSRCKLYCLKYGKEEAEEEDAKFFNEAHVNCIYIVMIAIFSGFKALPLLKLSLSFRQRYHFNYSFLNCTGRWKCGTNFAHAKVLFQLRVFL